MAPKVSDDEELVYRPIVQDEQLQRWIESLLKYEEERSGNK